MIRKALGAKARKTQSMLLLSVAAALLSGPAFANQAPELGRPIQTEMLAKVCGKGEPVNLPKLTSGNAGVVLWDELPAKDGKGSNIQIGNLNLQSSTMTSIR
ncbi:hypothetical protein HFU84_02185 [Acidithiobacillus sp. CV18-2]|uniref:Uncharacterized protein n=1 Tax=Igneacidithiobacillus copahuensis TaxID=2724909 RepID=A0AAE2YPY6_9PROT|nr:hypothetical protein [Igneacidithiobacillus copahuensis]MBU2753622.1 hypothetical protein [Acidithiobacillus sp. CV18-3]MBU2758526.1 hypothetical protein [Acidithiobacillus sp. BN09-2]MBU2776340.1 hypothetical protein [Acidithiobacillus sp. CV18-2]MBU2795256.1 hypothetical protein [Acidithiobacillus sp. VAN18-2]MBU2799518.1 hypothetical protein [Acidithiobacillus sp. VAN18-4]UTV81317.1 hypothetical protein MQE22_01505 [Acidithiobacillus sp. YTS05]